MNILDNLERLLSEEKERFEKIEMPNDIEDRLRLELEKTPVKKKRRFHLKAVAILIMVMLLGYNIDTLAYYGKKLLGYDTVMNATLQQLNELGKGQLIGKSHIFSDGVSVTLDGVMLDDNNLIMFYTLEDPNRNVEDVNSRIDVKITGFKGPMGYGGQGETDSEGKIQRWVYSTDRAPKFYENNIGLEIDYTPEGKGIEKGEIEFELDRNEAVGKSLTIPINKKVELKENSIIIDTMVASPTVTIVNGQIQNLLELGWDKIIGERFMTQDIDMSLYADGIELPIQGSSISTDMSGMNYDIRFGALPPKVKSLELKLTSFLSTHEVYEIISIETGGEKTAEILGQELIINDVYEQNGNTYVNITTEEYTTLTKVSLNIDGVENKLNKTIIGDMDKVVIGGEAKVYYTRTLEFSGVGRELKLHVERFSFNEAYDKVLFSYNIEEK